MSVIPISKAGMLQGGDEIELRGNAAGSRIVRFAPAVEVPPIGGDLVLRVQDLSGIAPNFSIYATIPEGERSCPPAGGSVPVAGDAPFFVFVVSAPAAPQPPSWLLGYVEDAGQAAGPFLCSVDDVKVVLKITTVDHDPLIADLVQRVSARISKFCNRSFGLARQDRLSLGKADRYLLLPDAPILTINSVTVNDVAVDPADFVELPSPGMLYRADGWPSGEQHILVNWYSGYSSIPADLVGACVSQTAFEFRRTAHGGNLLGRLSQQHEGGGATTYASGPWLPEVLDAIKIHRRIF